MVLLTQVRALTENWGGEERERCGEAKELEEYNRRYQTTCWSAGIKSGTTPGRNRWRAS
jgi:hypothetical protein